MGENRLRDRAMSDAAYVDQASQWAKWLTQREARGPGDLENGWRRLEARYGIPWRAFWALRYRKPASITAYLFDRMRAAYQYEHARQMRLLSHEIEVSKQTLGAADSAVVEVEALVQAHKEADEG